VLAIGVAGKQSHRYYAHVLAAVGAWILLFATAAWLSEKLDPTNWGFLGFLLNGLAWAIPIVIIANGYERKPIARLFPRRIRSSK
jgi:hypothetical protein